MCFMTLLQSVFLGIVQGLTEFLPVSSSGHLAIMQNIFHIDTGSSILFDILLHVGTLAVVFIVYWKDIWKLVREFFCIVADLFFNAATWFYNRKAITLTPYRRIVKNNYRKFVILILVSTIPTGIIGFLGKKLITSASQTLLVPGICLIITGILLLIADQARNCRKIPQDVTYKEGVIVGAAQGLATLPGLSRSGTTITACLLCGFDRKFAVKYSFILSIPAILGAAVLEIGDAAGEAVSGGQIGIYVAGMIAAAIVGYISIRSMLTIVKKRKFKYFSIYCFIVGAMAIIGHIFL